jgi:hypothetical protein
VRPQVRVIKVFNSRQPGNLLKGDEPMFDQIDRHEALGKKSLKEKIVEAAIILAVVGVMIGIMLYALEMA